MVGPRAALDWPRLAFAGSCGATRLPGSPGMLYPLCCLPRLPPTPPLCCAAGSDKRHAAFLARFEGVERLGEGSAEGADGAALASDSGRVELRPVLWLLKAGLRPEEAATQDENWCGVLQARGEGGRARLRSGMARERAELANAIHRFAPSRSALHWQREGEALGLFRCRPPGRCPARI